MTRKTKKCIWNGIEYDSITEAAVANNIDRNAMYARLKRGTSCDSELHKRSETKDIVIEIRRAFKNDSSVGIRSLAEKYNYSHITIRHMLFGYACYEAYNEYEAPITSLIRDK